MTTKRICKYFICLFYTTIISTTSIVYNLRIAETTKHSGQGYPHPSIASVTQVNQIRRGNLGSFSTLFGALVNLSYVPEDYYLRVDFAFGRIRSTLRSICEAFKAVQVDDILFSGGYTYSFEEHLKMTISGLLGIPTHNDFDLLLPFQLGTGHIGLGAQLDAAYRYQKNHALLTAVRAVHYLPRNVNILGFDTQFKFTPGTLIDIFIAHQTIFNQVHRFEMGYNPNFLVGARVKPFIFAVIQATNFVRSNFYASYKYLILGEYPQGFLLGLSGGFNHKPTHVGLKYGISVFASWGINF